MPLQLSGRMFEVSFDVSKQIALNLFLMACVFYLYDLLLFESTVNKFKKEKKLNCIQFQGIL